MVKVTAKKKLTSEPEPTESAPETPEDLDATFSLSHIDWENMYAYEKGSVHLGDLTIVSGSRNGEGKTSVVQALCYALTGSILGGTKIEGVKRSGASNLLAQVRGIWYGLDTTIARKITEDKESIEIFREKEEKPVKGLNANKELEEIVTINDFERLIYINGHNIESLMNDSMVTRSKTLDRLLNIDTFTITVAKIASIIAAIEKEIVEQNYQLTQKQTESTSLQKIIKDLPSKEALLKKLADLSERREKIMTEIAVIREKITSFAAKKGEITIFEKKSEELRQKLSTQKMMKDQYVETAEKYASQISKINEDILTRFGVETVDEAITEVESQIETVEKEITSLQEKLPKLKPIQSIYKQLLEKKLVTECPVCKKATTLKEIEIISKSEDSEIDRINTLIKKNTAKIASIRKDQLQVLIQYQSQIKVLAQQLNTARNKIVEYVKQIDYVQDQIKKLIAPSTIDESAYQRLRMDEVEKDRDQQNLQLFIDETNKQIKSSESIEDTRTLVASLQHEIDGLQLRIKELERQQTYAKELHRGIQNILINIRKELIEQLNPMISDWIRLFAPYSDSSLPSFEFALKLEEVHTAKKEHVEYSTIVKSGGKLITYETLSTGQRAICAIALILSIADIANHRLGLLVFDEIQTSGMDDIAINKLLDIMVMIAKNKTKIMMIDRRDDIIKSLYERAIKEKVNLIHYEAKRVDGISTIRRVYPV